MMDKKALMAGASVVALSLAMASPAAANPKNKFSPDAFASVTVNVDSNGTVGNVSIESENQETEVLATNIFTADFISGSIVLGDAAAAAAATADASAVASADASAVASAAATASAKSTSSATASAAAAASSNNESGAGNQTINADANSASAEAAAAATPAAADASASAAANAAAQAAAAADASAAASADAAAARGGDLINAGIVLSGNAMQRAAGAFAMNMVTSQFVNANAGNAIAAHVSSLTVTSN